MCVRVQVGIDEAERVISNSESDAHSSLVAKDSSISCANLIKTEANEEPNKPSKEHRTQNAESRTKKNEERRTNAINKCQQ